ncbi:hypothetical protein K0M31_014967 [Melipona bicolor]|uniref:Uncharacterized protein n=1 Tax=Melipona bicolor TaxID=60889 RepID=A0AA40FGL5_9HYME|nr:hypothetical protein K0M31_014967 [Melipona bicolor]
MRWHSENNNCLVLRPGTEVPSHRWRNEKRPASWTRVDGSAKNVQHRTSLSMLSMSSKCSRKSGDRREEAASCLFPHPRVGFFELTTRTEFTVVESGLDGHLRWERTISRWSRRTKTLESLESGPPGDAGSPPEVEDACSVSSSSARRRSCPSVA